MDFLSSLLLLLLLLLSASTWFPGGLETAQAHCLPHQAAALLEFRRGFSSSSDLRPWIAGTDCCSWDGVTCNTTSGMVTELDLSDRGISLSGPIDASLARLRSLSVLRLDLNNLSTTVLDFFGELSSLTELHLSGCGLRGRLPESVFLLPKLQVLYVGGNPELSWSWPEFPENSVLESLYLYETNCSGILSESLGNLKSLKRLVLMDCNIFGPIPSSIGNLTGLVGLYLNANNFQGQIPRSIFNLTGLKYLWLDGNKFNDTIELNLIKGLSNLTDLDLSNIPLSVRSDEGADSALSFPSISSLTLASCNLSKIPSFLRYQERMQVLDLSNNLIGGAIPEWVWSIGGMNMQGLDLSFNLFTHLEGTASTLPQSRINFLDLRSNQLRGQLPIPPPSSMPSNVTSFLNYITFFSLSNNSLSGKIPSSICNAHNLEVLDLSYNNFSGLIPPCLLQGDNNVTTLNLRGNRFRGGLPQNISQRCSLQILNLNANELQGRVPKSLANCRSLEVLDLGNNQIQDSFPSWLEYIFTLRVLILKSNQFYGHVSPPESREAFSKLQIFDLSSNKFDGLLPSKLFGNLKAMMVGVEHPDSTLVYLDFDKYSNFQDDTITITSKGFEMRLIDILKTLTYIDFSNNAFEGAIPKDIGNLKFLYTLNLSHNTLTGRIPPVLGTLSQLESLDLSKNHLSGEIPPELTSLYFLSSLNLSYNNLTGVIPTGTQFSTFPNNSFLGNEGLCGSPLSKKCSSPNVNVEPPSLESKNASLKLDEDLIWLCLFVGLGFGIGFAVGISLPILCIKRRRRERDIGCLNFVRACY